MIAHATAPPSPAPDEARWTIRYSLTERQRAAALRCYWRRAYGLRVLFTNTILLGYIVALLTMERFAAWRVPLSVAVGCVVLYSILTHVRFFVRHRRNHGAGDQRVTIRLTDDVLFAQMNETPTPIPWHATRRVMKRRTDWLITYGHDQFLILPTEDINPAALQFIVARVATLGALQTQCRACPTDSGATQPASARAPSSAPDDEPPCTA
ncbi:MAG TPA: hypothetical protein P5081_03265 [Phycisphaerae bacterium]|nr:hypothetical protein [Phycisphaerae bacterium]HRW51877.1 hypothetical protein [Phycisphaerae bacterium]